MDIMRTFFRASLAVAGIAQGTAVMAQASPSPYTSATRYDAMGRVTGTISADPDGVGTGNPHLATRTTYDPRGLPIKVEKGSMAVWPGNADPQQWSGFVVSTSVVTIYDVLGRKLTETAKGSDGSPVSLTQYSYDTAGRLECTTLRMNPAAYGSLPASACTMGTAGSYGPDRITKNIYDAAGQLLQKRVGVGSADEAADVTYSYTANGKQQYVIDANGNRAQLAFDGFDRQIAWIFPGKTLPTGYNDATPATALSTAPATASCALGSITEVGGVSGPSSTRSAGEDCETYGYDRNGNRGWLMKRDGSKITYQYDALNRNTVKIVSERSGLSATHTRDIYYGYNLTGSQLYARFDGPSGEGVTSTWNGFGERTSETLTMDGASRLVGSAYNANGVLTAMSYPDTTAVYYYRDGLDRLYYAGLDSTGYLFYPPYNADGSVAALYRYRPGTGWYASTSFAYDGLSRLAGLSSAFANGAYNSNSTFTRNPASQITSTTRDNDAYAWTGAVNADRNYTTNGLNHYTAAGPASFTYDPNGNLTSDGTSSFVYDIENRLVSKSGGSSSATLRYDPLGRLYEVNGPAEGLVRFLYDGDAMVMEFDGAGAIRRRIVHGAAEGVDDPLVSFEGSGVSDSVRRYFFADERGSIVALTDANGSVYAVNRYDEYGIPAASNAGRFQYTGQAWIPDLGMYYYKARMYSPTLGRFMQTDPIGYEDQFNLYAYVANDPINGVDPTGMTIACSTADEVTTCSDSESGNDFQNIDVDRQTLNHLQALVEPKDISSVVNGMVERAGESGASLGSQGSVGLDAEQRYIFTAGGEIDLKHVVSAGAFGDVTTAEVVGLGVEVVQAVAGFFGAERMGASAFSAEDMPSNIVGGIAASPQDMNRYHGGNTGTFGGNVARVLQNSSSLRPLTGAQALQSRGFTRVR